MLASIRIAVVVAAALGFLCSASDCQSTTTYTAYQVTRIEPTPSGLALHVVKRHVVNKGFANGSSDTIVEEHDLSGDPLRIASAPVAYGALPNGNLLDAAGLHTAAGALLWELAPRSDCSRTEVVIGPALAPDLGSFGIVSTCDGAQLRLTVVATDSGVVAHDVLFTQPTDVSPLIGLAAAPDHRVAVTAPGRGLVIGVDGTTSPLEIEGPFVSALGAGWVSATTLAAATFRFSGADGITLRRVTLPDAVTPLADGGAPNVASGAYYYVVSRRSESELVKDGAVIAETHLRVYDEDGNLVRELDPTF